MALAACREWNWLDLLTPGALWLVPVTRFGGFVWLIAAGFALPTAIERAAPAAGEAVAGRAA